ncbi:hypothetical protein PORY_000430 [Pneumocystis oryctolagi]|uniref:Uncharacterized protein n=1 Tax=Pneumocystis oryctolagi TaxID=42067 RepID=A0ACB7CGS2_9ASCO|nr:hypothetical protein PORY_000430 [Pneumocystis oryctolagi]
MDSGQPCVQKDTRLSAVLGRCCALLCLYRLWTDEGVVKNEKQGEGQRPMVVFSGSLFDSEPVYRLCKSMFLDFFCGERLERVDVQGLQHAVCLSVQEATEETPQPPIYFRVYRVVCPVRGGVPMEVELEEIGPRYDLVIQRVQEAKEEEMQEAMKRGEGGGEKKKKRKNIDVNEMGDKVGRIHMGKQDMNRLQIRKFKGLKRKRGEEALFGCFFG